MDKDWKLMSLNNIDALRDVAPSLRASRLAYMVNGTWHLNYLYSANNRGPSSITQDHNGTVRND